MVAFLDDFYVQVGLPCGHTRHGSIKKRRRPRAEIMAARRAAEGVELANRHKNKIVSAAYDEGLQRGLADADEQTLAIIVAADRQADTIKAEAKRWAKEAKEQARHESANVLNNARAAADMELRTAKTRREEAAKELAAAKQDRAKAANIGGRVGAFVAGITGATSRIREEIVSVAEGDLARSTESIAALRDDKVELQRRIQTLEKNLAESRERASQMQTELEMLHAKHDRDHADAPEVGPTPKI